MPSQTEIGIERPSATSSSSFRADVEGLRAIAVGVVVLYHFHLGPFRGGFVGVDVFFVISGFIITRMLLRERERDVRTSFVGFYARRIRRIAPAATAVLVATAIASYVVLGSISSITILSDIRSASLFFANVHFAHTATNYFSVTASPSPVVHFWSLSIEEQFYLVWPALLALLALVARPNRSRMVLGGGLTAVFVGAMLYSVAATGSSPVTAYYSSFIRAGELALGALVAVAAPATARLPRRVAVYGSWVGLAGIFASALVLSDATEFPGWAVMAPIVATAVVIGCGEGGARGAVRLLGWRPFVWLGGLSYSLYLWHWPVYALASDDLGHSPWLGGRLVLFVVALGLAWASYRYLEVPVRSSSWLKMRPRVTYGLGAILISVTLTTTLVLGALGNTATEVGPLVPLSSYAQLQSQLASASLQQSLPPLVVPLKDVGGDFPKNRGCLVLDTATTATGSRPSNCFWGDRHSSRTLVLYGDSNAAMWLLALNKIGLAEHFRVDLVARERCFVADLNFWNWGLEAPDRGCTAFHNWALTHIKAERPFAILAVDYESIAHYTFQKKPYSTDAYQSALTSTIHILSGDAPWVGMMSEPPYPSTDPTECLDRNQHHIQSCSISRDGLVLTNGESLEDPAVSAGGGVPVVLSDLFCTATICPAVIDHVAVRLDSAHVSKHYTLLIWRLLQSRLNSDGMSRSLS